MKKNHFLIVLLIIALTLYIGFVFLTDQQLVSWVTSGGKTPIRNTIDTTIPTQYTIVSFFLPIYAVKIHAIEPDIPTSIPLLKGTFQQGDLLNIENGSLMTPKSNVPSEADAQKIAEQILQYYGGLPHDAKFSSSHTNFFEMHRSSTGEILERKATDTTVFYHREINGTPIVGQCDKITIFLGNNGELLSLYKSWRTLENTGKNVTLISLSEAIEKIQSNELISRPRTIFPIAIDNISIGYYQRSRTEPEIFLEPVWIFTGKTLINTPVVIVVYARKFAEFTNTPLSDKSSLTIRFTDTSGTSPIKWNWDFGDGATSTEQNPVHTYQKNGKYSVSLTVWNDLGSDKKTQIISINSIPIHLDNSANNLTYQIDSSTTTLENHRGL
jgi:hypothetical protein